MSEYDVSMSLLVTADNVVDAVTEAIRLVSDCLERDAAPGQIDVRDEETGLLHEDVNYFELDLESPESLAWFAEEGHYLRREETGWGWRG